MTFSYLNPTSLLKNGASKDTQQLGLNKQPLSLCNASVLVTRWVIPLETSSDLYFWTDCDQQRKNGSSNPYLVFTHSTQSRATRWLQEYNVSMYIKYINHLVRAEVYFWSYSSFTIVRILSLYLLAYLPSWLLPYQHLFEPESEKYLSILTHSALQKRTKSFMHM